MSRSQPEGTPKGGLWVKTGLDSYVFQRLFNSVSSLSSGLFSNLPWNLLDSLDAFQLSSLVSFLACLFFRDFICKFIPIYRLLVSFLPTDYILIPTTFLTSDDIDTRSTPPHRHHTGCQSTTVTLVREEVLDMGLMRKVYCSMYATIVPYCAYEHPIQTIPYLHDRPLIVCLMLQLVQCFC